jgi:hypothetical protein
MTEIETKESTVPRNNQPRPAQLRHSRATTRAAHHRAIAKRSRVLRDLNICDRKLTERGLTGYHPLTNRGAARAWREFENDLCRHAANEGQAGPRFFIPTRVLLDMRGRAIASGDWYGRLFALLPRELRLRTRSCGPTCDYCERKRWRNAGYEGWRAHMSREEASEIRTGVNEWLDDREEFC